MIRVTVEMLPGGDEKARRTIAVVDVSKVSDLAEVSDYHVGARPHDGRGWNGMLTGHARKDGWAVLLGRVFWILARAGVK